MPAVHVFNEWLQRKIARHPNRTEFKVPHAIARHMVHCKCPKPEHDDKMYLFQEEYKIYRCNARSEKWRCMVCNETIHIVGT